MQRLLKKLAIATIGTASALFPSGCVATDGPDADVIDSLNGQSAQQPAGSPSKDDDAELRTTLFVLGPNTGLVGFDAADGLNGLNLPATTELMAGNSTVIQPRDAALDRRGALYVISGANGGSIAIYENPLSATGTRPPDRAVFGAATLLSKNPTGIAIDRDNDLLFVSNAVTDMLVFDIRSPESFDGNIAPLRTFRIDLPLFSPEQIRFANG